MRIWATSDLHIDYNKNKQWCYGLSNYDYTDDILIIAGDVSHEILEVAHLFRKLAKKFKQLFFVPGNHDVWLMPGERFDSLQKFHDLLAMSSDEGASTQPLVFGQVKIVPLFSWYDFSFGTPKKAIQRAWQDFKRCKWAENLEQLTQYFIALNSPHLQATGNTDIISFSHFLPSAALIPPQVPTLVKALLPVFGCRSLGEQVKQLDSAIHVYGHSHLNRKVGLDNTVYINNAYGYPHETPISRKRLFCLFDDGQLLF